MAKLYELTEKYINFNRYAEDLLENEELTEEDVQMLTDTLNSIEDSISEKAENICKYLKHLEGDISTFKAEEDRLAKRRKTMTNTYESLKSYTKSMLELAKLDKVQAGTFKLSLRKNPPSTEIIDEKKIPKIYKIKQPDKIDKKQILEALKQGEKIKGVKLADEKKILIIS